MLDNEAFYVSDLNSLYIVWLYADRVSLYFVRTLAFTLCTHLSMPTCGVALHCNFMIEQLQNKKQPLLLV